MSWISDESYLRLALRALASDIAILKVAALAAQHGDNREARWWLDHSDSGRWIRACLRHDLSSFYRYPPSLA